jgi:glycogen(starch) synthase
VVLIRTALWAVPVSDLAGVARHALDVAGHGVPGWDLVFLTPPGRLPGELRARGARVVEARFGPDHGVARSLRTLHTTLADVRPAVLHAHLSYADLLAAAALPRGVRLVTTEHGVAVDDIVYHRSPRKARLMARVHRLRFRRVAAPIAVSQATAAAMRAKWEVTGPIHLVRNGVDRPAPSASTPGLRILSLARLAPEKRIADLVRAFALVARDHDDATLTVAGTGPLEASLRATADSVGLGDRIDFLGFVDAEKALADADVVAMLSVSENCSYTLLDAAAAGLGVVASPVGGNPEILPAHCLVDPTRPGEVAAALVRQGLDSAARPGLADWPDVRDMCAAIAGVYDEVTA